MSRRHENALLDRLIHSGLGLIASTRGTTAIEYALLASMVAVVLVGALGGLGDAIRDLPLPALVDAFASVLS